MAGIQSSQGKDCLNTQVESFAGGCQDFDLRRCFQDVQQQRRRVEQVLEIVEDQQDLAAAEMFQKLLPGIELSR